jgi:anti-anti-sigma factor
MIVTAADMGFRLEATFVGFEAVLSLHGEVDLGSAPEFGAYLDWAIDQGHRFVVIDLGGLSFMDGSGLRVIGGAAKRLQLYGGALSVRSPSTSIRRLLDIGGLADLVRIEQPFEQPIETSDGIEMGKAVGFPVRSVSAASAGRSAFLKSMAAVPPDDGVVNGALRLVVALAQTTVGGADGVSISLRRRGTLSTVAASDQVILAMDAGQYETGEGPCVDASVKGRRFYTEALDTETRWPAFTPKARALGINSILSSPLEAGKIPVGALNIYSRTTSAFAVKDRDLASVFAREASVILSHAQVDMTDQQLHDRMTLALRTRELISQAQGVIMHRDGIGEDLAYTRLRRDSLQNGRPLHDRAREVVDSARRRPDASDDVLEVEHG